MYSYTMGESTQQADVQTYGSGHSVQTLYITNELTGEKRTYEGFTYIDADNEEDLQVVLSTIWEEEKAD